MVFKGTLMKDFGVLTIVCILYTYNTHTVIYIQYRTSSVLQSLSHVQLCNPWTVACQAPLSVISSNHFILCCLLFLLPSIFPSIMVFSSVSGLHIRWPKYWSFSFSISPSNDYPGLMSFGMDWLDLLAVQGTLKSLLQHHNWKASILWCLVGLCNKNTMVLIYFLSVLEARCPRSMCFEVHLWWDYSSWLTDDHLFVVFSWDPSSVWDRNREPWVSSSSCKDTSPARSDPTFMTSLDPNHLPKAPP